MDLKDYFLSLETKERQEFAERAETTVNYIPLLTGGHRLASPAMARRLSDASNGAVSLSDLRPDIWPPSEAA